MQAGIFGKLPAKRDFVSYGLTRPFLDGWEQWLQAGIAESRHALGEAWKDIYLTLPIFRFWVGPGVFGQAAAGAIMASVDGVGRYFPLTLCACAEPGECPIAANDPELDRWLGTVEQALLSLLQDQMAFDPPAILESLGVPPATALSASAGPVQPLAFWTNEGRTLQQAFDDVENADHSRRINRRGLWWTMGGEHHVPQLITTEGEVPAALWTSFLTGQVAT